jgi:hypothetical protein
MKFLSKNPNSDILKKGLIYQENKAANNKLLREELLKEQKNFCAYTEKYIQELDATEVEHFNPHLKYHDDYYNYYAVIRKPNQYKNNQISPNSEFFTSRFFQNRDEFNSRIQFKDGIYFQVEESDNEAKELIDFLGFNHHTLAQQRSRHIKRLSKIFEIANYSNEQRLEYFSEHIEELSFITAVEVTFNVDLESFL